MDIRFTCNKKKYRLTSDEKQFILDMPQGKNNQGVEVFTKAIFLPKLEMMLTHLYDIGLRNNEVDSFRALVKHSERVCAEVLRISALINKETI